ncbi:cytosine permease [Govanella unica]|uniref:Cytosine permease n=1 Tax=Govanella unica TaxID=2975056 RepID=A0A9X3TZ42_9PROT|nr:cytosine permease [Govania unica]MDA5194124.1 cytosine permease [Govania unica]
MAGAFKSDDYAHSAVPADQTVSGWRIALIKIGIVIALPGFITGAEIGFALGLGRGTLAILIGGLMLMTLGMLTGTVAAKSRLTTSLITQFAFGTLGGRLINVVLALTLLGWFGVTAQIFGESVNHIASTLFDIHLLPQVYILIGGIMMVITTMYGFKALQRLSDITVPLLMIMLGITAWLGARALSMESFFATPDHAIGLGFGISTIAGALATSVTIFPDLSRFARTPSDARLASGVTFGIGLPAVLLLAAIPSVATQQKDIVIIMTSLGLGAPALILLVFKAWATNSGNLYSGSLGLATILERLPQWGVVIAAGTVGIALAVFGISDYLRPYLMLLGITIPPITGIYLADFFLLRRQVYDLSTLHNRPRISWTAFVAWGSAIAIGTLSARSIVSLSGIPACDAIATAFLIYLGLNRLSSLSSKLHLEKEDI